MKSNKARQEGLADMLRVVLLCQAAFNLYQLCADDLEAALLKAAQNLSRQTALNRVRLNENQSSFNRHRMLVSPIW